MREKETHSDVPAPPPARAADSPAGNAAEAKNLVVFVNLLGRVVNGCSLYGLQHPLTVSAMEEAYAALLTILSAVNEIHLILAEDALIVNEAMVDGNGPWAATVSTTMQDRGIAGLRFLPGISPDEFIKIMTLLTANPKDFVAKPFTKHLEDAGLVHVGSRTATYRQVYDDQVVLDKKELESLANSPGVEQIIAFLKGEATPSEQTPFPSVQVAANDVHTLADLILRATQGRLAPDGSPGGESLGDLMVACLRRTFDGLSRDPAVRTQKGKKKLSATLAVLEESLLQKLRDLAGPNAPAVAERISASMGEMRDELDIGALVAEYGRRKKASDASEKRIVRLMETVGPDGIVEKGLSDKMAKAGVSLDGWQTLIAKSTQAESRPRGADGGGTGVAPPATGAGDELGGDLRMLSIMLTELSKAMETASTADEVNAATAGFRHLLDKSGVEMLAATGRAEGKLDALLKPAAAAPRMGGADRPNRHEILRLLTDVVGELRQPIAVIACCHDLLTSRRLGDLTMNQEQTLKLAATSLDRIESIVGKLGRLAQSLPGNPEGARSGDSAEPPLR